MNLLLNTKSDKALLAELGIEAPQEGDINASQACTVAIRKSAGLRPRK